MTIIPCPSFATVEEAVDYLTARGCTRIVLWVGDDGLVRGNGATVDAGDYDGLRRWLA